MSTSIFITLRAGSFARLALTSALIAASPIVCLASAAIVEAWSFNSLAPCFTSDLISLPFCCAIATLWSSVRPAVCCESLHAIRKPADSRAASVVIPKDECNLVDDSFHGTLVCRAGPARDGADRAGAQTRSRSRSGANQSSVALRSQRATWRSASSFATP